MENYTVDQLLKLARRHHNTKRTYLLVNPLQGKHIPVSPTESLGMLRTLGRRFAEAAPEVDLVIGFAETATAVGAVVASMLSNRCRYIHTTREPSAVSDQMIEFQEEHSHATEQFLCLNQLGPWLREAHAVAFVDDELSTGKTLLNMISEVRQRFPEIIGKSIWAVSIINRLTDERIAVLEDHGIRSFSLMKLPMLDLTSLVEKYSITAPLAAVPCKSGISQMELAPSTVDPRFGCEIGSLVSQCRTMAESVYRQINSRIKGKRVSIIGTEEWMLPGMLLGEFIEARGEAASVRFHATTRSPIGICSDPEYPIQSGIALHSFYAPNRPTFLYDLQPSDVVLILTDSLDKAAARHACEDLCGAYMTLGCTTDIILIKEAVHVRYISSR